MNLVAEEGCQEEFSLLHAIFLLFANFTDNLLYILSLVLIST